MRQFLALIAPCTLALTGCLGLLVPQPAPAPAAPPPMAQPQTMPPGLVAIPTQKPLSEWDWDTRSSVSDIDGSTNFAAAKPASAEYVDADGQQRVPKLLLFCEEHKLRVAVLAFGLLEVDYDDAMHAKVTVRVDEGKARGVRAQLDPDLKKLYLPDAERLVASLRSASRLVVQFTARGGRPVSSEFVLGEIAPVLEQLAKSCPIR